jgi:hypothetical protein
VDDNLFYKLRELTTKDGPFIEYTQSEPILAKVLHWIGNDTTKLRDILNYTFERGERRGLEQVQSQLQALLTTIKHREIGLWQTTLLGRDINDKATNPADFIETR